MTSQWQPSREPLRITMLRTGLIAIVVGAVLARFWGGLARWPLTTLLVLWASFGGHWWRYGSSTGCVLAYPSRVAFRLQLALGYGSWVAPVLLLAWV